MSLPQNLVDEVMDYMNSPYPNHLTAFNMIRNAGNLRIELGEPNTNQDGFIIIGPPGTGKTYLIVRGTIAYLIDHPTYKPTARLPPKVFILTYTNAAAYRVIEAFDELFDKVGLNPIEKESIVRRIISERIPRSLETVYDVPRSRLPLQLEEDWVTIKNPVENFIPILVGTIDTMSRIISGDQEGTISGIDPSLILIDEASQINAAQFNLAVNKGRTRFQAVGLIGDPAQLPPISSIIRLQESALSYLIGGGGRPNRIRRTTILRTQFRMRTIINKFRKQFALMQSDVNTDVEADIRSISITTNLPDINQFPNVYQILNEDKPIVIIDTSNLSYNDSNVGNSYINRQEAEIADKIGLSFINAYPDLTLDNSFDLFLMSPFRPQANLLEEVSKSRAGNLNGFRAGTANSFQGQDAKVSIISMTRSNTIRGSLVFLEQDQRLNVLFSRSQVKVVVIANRNYLSQGEKLKQIFNFADNPENVSLCTVVNLSDLIIDEIDRWNEV